MGLFYGVGETVYSVFVWVGCMEAEVYPSVLDVDAFGFESDVVEVDGVDFLAGVEVDDVQPIVSRAVAVGQIGVAVVDFAALGHGDTVDGYGAQHVGVGEVYFGSGRRGETELFQEHGSPFAATIGIEFTRFCVETPVLGHGEVGTVVVDALHDGGANGGKPGDKTGFVAVAGGDVKQREGIAVEP